MSNGRTVSRTVTFTSPKRLSKVPKIRKSSRISQTFPKTSRISQISQRLSKGFKNFRKSLLESFRSLGVYSSFIPLQIAILCLIAGSACSVVIGVSLSMEIDNFRNSNGTLYYESDSSKTAVFFFKILAFAYFLDCVPVVAGFLNLLRRKRRKIQALAHGMMVGLAVPFVWLLFFLVSFGAMSGIFSI